MIDPNKTYTIADRDIDKLRNILESIDVFLDGLKNHLPEFNKAYNALYADNNDLLEQRLRKLHLIKTINEHSRQQLREVLKTIYVLRNASVD